MEKNFLFISDAFERNKDDKLSTINSFNNNLCNKSYGFFILSLKCIGNVEIAMGLEEGNAKLNKNYDMIFLDIKSLIFNGLQTAFFNFCNNIKNQQVCLLVNTDNLFSNLLDLNKILIPNLKLIYVVNLIKDYDRYCLSNSLRDKLRLTYYGLGTLDIKYDFNVHKFSQLETINYESKNDIFFSGILSNSPIRKLVCEFILKEFPEKRTKIIINERLTKQDYINNILSSKINLALSGNFNNLTYRHNEILFLNSFLLSDYAFSEFKISENFSNLDSFCFKTTAGLKDLIYFYINFDDEREKVCKDLNTIFKNFYSPKKFSESMYKDLFA
jgi:hypothetical protein